MYGKTIPSSAEFLQRQERSADKSESGACPYLRQHGTGHPRHGKQDARQEHEEISLGQKLTASFNFEGALEVAAAAAALAQGREDLVSGSDGTLPSWYRDPTKSGRDGSAKTIGFYRPKDQSKGSKLRYFLGITENNKDKQGNKIGISLEYPDLFKIARVMEEAALAILGWRKEIEGQREPNGRDRAAKSKPARAEAF